MKTAAQIKDMLNTAKAHGQNLYARPKGREWFCVIDGRTKAKLPQALSVNGTWIDVSVGFEFDIR